MWKFFSDSRFGSLERPWSSRSSMVARRNDAIIREFLFGLCVLVLCYIAFMVGVAVGHWFYGV
jgi:hypothetical protein